MLSKGSLLHSRFDDTKNGCVGISTIVCSTGKCTIAVRISIPQGAWAQGRFYFRYFLEVKIALC